MRVPLNRSLVKPTTKAVIAGLVSASLMTVMSAGTASAAPTSPPSYQPSLQQTSEGLTSLGVTASSDGWLTYTKSTSSSLGLANTKTTTVVGTRDADGICVVSGTASGTTPTYSEEVAFNPTTCAAKVFTGTITAAAAAKLAANEGTDNATEPVTAPALPSSTGGVTTNAADAAAAATSYQKAHTSTSWIDPVFITITRQTVNLRWPLYGAGGTLSSTYPAYKFAYDGWSVSGPHFSGFKTLSGNAGWYVSADSHFINYDFAALVYALLGLSGWLACGAHTTTRADFYHNDKVTGRRNNTASYDWSDRKSGACSNLVHHKTRTGLGWV